MATLKVKLILLTFNSYLNVFLTKLLYFRRTYFNCLSIFNARLFEHFHHHSYDTLPVILNANLKIGIFLYFYISSQYSNHYSAFLDLNTHTR